MNTPSTMTEPQARKGSLTRPAIVIAAAVILGFGAIVWLAETWRSGGTGVTQETVSQPLMTATRAEVAITMGLGTLELDAREPSTNLIEGTVGRREREQVTHDFRIIGETGHYTLRTEGKDTTSIPFRFRREQNVRWDLHLNRDVPMALKVDTGAGTARLDLRELRATNVEVRTGVGATTLMLPKAGQPRVEVDGGVGTTTVLIPAGIAARIEVEAGLGSASVQGDYKRNENMYVSSDYETATDRVDLRIRGGIGNITVRKIGEE